jgi:hypothetical protein
MKQAKQSTDRKPTPGTVNGDVICPWFSPSVTSLTPSTCTRITSFPTTVDVAHTPLSEPSSPLCKSVQFCKSTTVLTVELTHYMKLNTIRTISYSVKTDNMCFVQICCIANYKITDTKESPQQRTLLLKNIMADGCTMFSTPTMNQTNPAHTSTWFNGKYEIEVMFAHPKVGRYNIKCSGK